MRAVITPNTQTGEREKGSAMEAGHVAWAGGSSGPDLFMTLSRVHGFGGSHTVWGELDAESLELAKNLVRKPVRPANPGEMHMLAEPIRFNLTVHEPAGAA